MERSLILLNAVLIAIFLIIGIMVRGSKEGIIFDQFIMEYIHDKVTPSGIKVMKKTTYLGSAYFFILMGIMILLYMLKGKRKREIYLLFLSTIGSYGLNVILKNIFIRTRPLEFFLIEQGGYSFPSGHAMVSMTFYSTMTYLITRKINNRGLKTMIWLLNFIIIALIGLSRIYLGVHWPTDVLMGFIVGLIFTHGSIKTMRSNK